MEEGLGSATNENDTHCHREGRLQIPIHIKGPHISSRWEVHGSALLRKALLRPTGEVGPGGIFYYRVHLPLQPRVDLSWVQKEPIVLSGLGLLPPWKKGGVAILNKIMERVRIRRAHGSVWSIRLSNGNFIQTHPNGTTIFYDREGRFIEQRFKDGSLLSYNREERLHGFAKVTGLEYCLYIRGLLRGLYYIKQTP